MEIIAKNPEKYDKLDESKKELFVSMTAKFSIEIKLRADPEESEKEIKSSEENHDHNNSLDEKSSLNDGIKVNDNNNKYAMLKPTDKEMETEIIPLGFREPNEINNLENNLDSNRINNINSNISVTNSNLINNLTSNNKSNLSIIKEEKEVLSNSFKNNFSEELVSTANPEKKSPQQKINGFVNNNEKETNTYPVNTDNRSTLIKDSPDQFNIEAKQVKKNINNNKNTTSENSSKEKADNVLPANKHKKRLTIVDSKTQDEVDEKLDNYLINTYNKKKMSFIPMRRVSENNYEFGSQKIEIKIDDEIIRGIYLNILFNNNKVVKLFFLKLY